MTSGSEIGQWAYISNIFQKGGFIEGEVNYMEIYLSYISKTIDESFPNPHLIITEHPDKWLGKVFTVATPRPDHTDGHQGHPRSNKENVLPVYLRCSRSTLSGVTHFLEF